VSNATSAHNPTDDPFNVITQLTHIPSGTTLWDVYATDAPAPAGQQSRFIQIGSIVTASEPVLSLYGDRSLFFQHQTFENDFIMRPDWHENCPDLLNCISCNDPVNNRICF
jgi:hypothetical protein